MEKVYIVLEESYNLLADENGASYIYGCYDTKEKAIDKAIEMINVSLEDDWVLDENDLEDYNSNPRKFVSESYARTFWKYQENWAYYSEISVKELEVK